METCNCLATVVRVGFHPGDTVVRHILGQVRVQLLLRHVLTLLVLLLSVLLSYFLSIIIIRIITKVTSMLCNYPNIIFN